MAHHGYAPKELIKFVGLPEHYYHPFATEALSAVNFMKCALQFSKKITTVSPRYSEEIKTKGQGYGLDDVLRYRAADLIGILNGIDTNTWDPQTDKFITKNFSVESMSGKQFCKLALQKELNLPIDEKIPYRASSYVEEYALSHTMELADALIAGTCVEKDEILYTANEKHYRMIDDLRVNIFRP